MKDFLTREFTLSILLVLSILFFIHPANLLMPMGVEMIIGLFVIIIFMVYASLIWKEKPKDEREDMHRQSAGRLAFLVGSFTLILGIMYQSMSHNIDPWLPAALISMLVAKFTSRLYSHRKR